MQGDSVPLQKGTADLKSISEAEILQLLEEEPENGMAVLVKHYSGLLWSVSKQYLSDPEDIKECVNDTFLEFHLHRERFNPEKGSLVTFLSTIVKNLSISRYRQNSARKTDPLAFDVSDTGDLIAQAEAHVVMEQLLGALKEEDAEIIRLKYCDEMSVREIAREMDLPYENVKKRHQRSITRLRRFLLGLLILLLAVALTACAYVIFHYLGVIPGYGISSDSSVPAYVLKEPLHVESELGVFTLDAAILEGTFFLRMDLERAEDLSFSDASDPFGYHSAELLSGLESCECSWSFDADGGVVSVIKVSSSDAVISMAASEAPETLAFTLRLEGPGLERLEIPLQLACYTPDPPSKYSCQIGELGGLLAIPRLENGRLLVGLYPLNTGAFTISTNLIRGLRMEGKLDDITATAPDGAVLTGECTGTSLNSGDYFYDWDFGPAAPGEYQLHIPYVYVGAPLSEALQIPLDLERCTWEEREYPVLGGTLSVEDCKPLGMEAGEKIPGSYISVEEGYSYWAVKMRYRAQAGLKLSECSPQSIQPFRQNAIDAWEEIKSSGLWETPSYEISSLELQPEPECSEFLLKIRNGAGDFSQTILEFSAPLSVRWEHCFELSFSVE